MAKKYRMEQSHCVLACLCDTTLWQKYATYIEPLWLRPSEQKVFDAIQEFHRRHPDRKTIRVSEVEAMLAETGHADIELTGLNKASRLDASVRERSSVRFIKEHSVADAIAKHQQSDQPMNGVADLITRLETIERLTATDYPGYDYLWRRFAPKRFSHSECRKVPTPVRGLTKLLNGGLEPTDLVTVMGVPDAGKTLLCCAWGAYAARRRCRVLHVTTETTRWHVARRYDCAITGASEAFLDRNPKLVQRTRDRVRKRGGRVILHDLADSESSVGDIRRLTERFTEQYGRLDLVIIDRADLLSAGARKRDYSAIARDWQALRRLAAARDCVIIATTQVNREGSKLKGEKLDLGHVGEGWGKVCDAPEVIAIGASMDEKRLGRCVLMVLKTKKPGGYGRNFLCHVDRIRCALREIEPMRRIKPDEVNDDEETEKGV